MNNLTKLIIAVLTPTQLLAEPIELNIYTKVLDYSKYSGKSWIVEATVDELGNPVAFGRSTASSVRDLGQVDPGLIYFTIGCEVDKLIAGIITTTHRVIRPEKPSENSGFHPFCEEKSPDSSTSHPMKNARRTDRLDDP